ncbi:sodium:solute symporter [Flavihumibacter petaseus]|uniref:Putative SSS family transporter n=1 Tax=Flavihumibacter petaseus NBRC 106054 TaxID=1220578 RepID=A0A0E9N0S4_9BACT|nr:sodium:solute symporter [Flavihumibacter petaseus]GAO42960.1 putative SSS family transporter [Flavihumibacter petaseus NBRC 106054]
MSALDWIILIATLTGIVAYGLFKSRSSHNIDGYFLSNRSLPWYMVLLSIMGTQASAITFLSAPGQAYSDGMRFVQYYFGVPLAMIVICIFFVPIFHRLRVVTAYEYLEQRFDKKTRTFIALIFLISRGVSTGISIYAPSIILSSLLGWNIYWTNLFMGGLLIIYTVTGGAKAVAYTQQLQLIVIFLGLFLAAYMTVHLLPDGIGFLDALKVSGKMGRLNVITTGKTANGFDWNDRYNIWSGLLGGGFLALSYFGTDQSQVGRYLTARSLSESRIGLLMNGLVKVPMQFAILLIGALVFTFYQLNPSPVFFNPAVRTEILDDKAKASLDAIEGRYQAGSTEQAKLVREYALSGEDEQFVQTIRDNEKALEITREEYKAKLKEVSPATDTNDTNYVFLRFVIDHLPTGLVGLLIAVIFLAAWGSIAAALNSLAASSVCDLHQQYQKAPPDPETSFRLSRWYTFAWGVFCIIVAQFANNMGSLIEAVNVLGSIFYGTMLGIFLVAFFLPKVGANAGFYSAMVTQAFIFLLFWKTSIGFLWMNVIGAGFLVLFSLLLHATLPKRSVSSP